MRNAMGPAARAQGQPQPDQRIRRCQIDDRQQDRHRQQRQQRALHRMRVLLNYRLRMAQAFGRIQQQEQTPDRDRAPQQRAADVGRDVPAEADRAPPGAGQAEQADRYRKQAGRQAMEPAGFHRVLPAQGDADGGAGRCEGRLFVGG